MRRTQTLSGVLSIIVLPVAAAAVAVAVGCASFATSAAWPTSSALGSDLHAYRPSTTSRSTRGARRFKEPTGTLTLRQALAAALIHNPQLRATAWAVRAREAERMQAQVLPNPELEVTVEDFGVSGNLRGVREMGLTFAVRQVIWLGGQRARRSRLAARQSREAGWAYELKRLVVLTRTVQAFIAVVAAQKLDALVRQEEELGRKVVHLFRERSKAGRIARRDLGLIRAEIRLSRTGLKRLQVQRQLAVARQKLAASWGGIRPRFHRASGRLNRPPPLRSLDGLLTRTRVSPRVRAWQARVATRRAAVVLAKAGAIPSLTVTGGARVLPDSRSVGFLVGLSIPLPFLDRNQGATRAARFRVHESRDRLRAARVRVASLVAQAYGNVLASRGTLRRINKLILPKAQTAVTVALDAYREGKAGYLAVLDAQRTLVQLRVERLSAQAGLLTGLAELELLLGEPVRVKSKGKRP